MIVIAMALPYPIENTGNLKWSAAILKTQKLYIISASAVRGKETQAHNQKNEHKYVE